jgi:hypothetical protein
MCFIISGFLSGNRELDLNNYSAGLPVTHRTLAFKKTDDTFRQSGRKPEIAATFQQGALSTDLEKSIQI